MFLNLHKLLVSVMMLFSDFLKPLLLDTDASTISIGGVPSQVFDGKEQVITHSVEQSGDSVLPSESFWP